MLRIMFPRPIVEIWIFIFNLAIFDGRVNCWMNFVSKSSNFIIDEGGNNLTNLFVASLNLIGKTLSITAYLVTPE